MENQIVHDKSQPNFLPIDKRLTTGGISSFKTTSTPVTKSSVKSEMKLDSEEQTGSIDSSLLISSNTSDF